MTDGSFIGDDVLGVNSVGQQIKLPVTDLTNLQDLAPEIAITDIKKDTLFETGYSALLTITFVNGHTTTGRIPLIQGPKGDDGDGQTNTVKSISWSQPTVENGETYVSLNMVLDDNKELSTKPLKLPKGDNGDTIQDVVFETPIIRNGESYSVIDFTLSNGSTIRTNEFKLPQNDGFNQIERFDLSLPYKDTDGRYYADLTITLKDGTRVPEIKFPLISGKDAPHVVSVTYGDIVQDDQVNTGYSTIEKRYMSDGSTLTIPHVPVLPGKDSDIKGFTYNDNFNGTGQKALVLTFDFSQPSL